LFFIYYLGLHFSSEEKGEKADVFLKKGGHPMTVLATITDKAGNPLSSVEVDIRNSSGGNIGMTDSEGITEISVGEREIEKILVNGLIVLNRPYANYLRYPTAENGVKVKIIMKRHDN